MSQNAIVNLDGQTFELPTLVGTENEKAIDIAKLRDLSGYVTYDPGYKNTGATKSAITFFCACGSINISMSETCLFL